MPTLQTNILRIQLNSLSLQYQLQLQTILEQQHLTQIQTYFNNIQPNLIYSHPYLYSKVLLSQLNHEVYMSNGQLVSFVLKVVKNDVNSQSILHLIATKMIKISELLYSQELGYCMNPYQQRKNDKHSIIPAYTIQTIQKQQQICFYYVPMHASINFASQINQRSNVLVDYQTGNFYKRSDIVRFDKQNGFIHFRNNKIISKSGLHPIQLKIINGFELGNELYHFYDRVKQTTKAFCQLWQLKFDNYFLQNQFSYTNPGSLTFRINQEKTLSEIITPINEYSWIQKSKLYFNGITFDDLLQTNLVFLYPLNMQTIIKQFTTHLEAINYRMGNDVVMSHVGYQDINNTEQICNGIVKYQIDNKGKLVYFIPYSSRMYENSREREGFQRFVQFIIDQKCIFHLVEIGEKEYDFETQAYRHLAMMYTKLRLNPWKIKTIPFTNKPMVVMTLDISIDRNQQYSISLVSTMNFFLSKFTCTLKKCPTQTLLQTIEQSIKECIQKFKEAHKTYPNRIFLIRTGLFYDTIIDEFNYIRSSIQAYSGSRITYITLSTDHHLRTFIQLDHNYVAQDNVKKLQLLANTINGELYYQLELQQSMHLVRIYEIGELDPNFTTNVLELLAKVVFGSVGNTYGRGLGFIDFSRKLNGFRQYNIASWSQLLKQGYVTFI